MGRYAYLSMLCFLLMGVSSKIAFSQNGNNSKTDSLLNLMSTAQSDTLKVDIYLSLNTSLNKVDSSRAMQYLQKAIFLSKEIGDDNRLAKSYLRLAHIYDIKGNLPAAKAALDSIKGIKNIKSDKIKATFFMQKGIILYFEGTYKDAVENLWEAVRYYEKLNDSVTVASCYMTIGASFMELEKSDQALEYYKKALLIYKNRGYEDGVAMALGNIGIIYKDKKAYTEALSYYNESLAFNEKNNRTEDAMIDLSNIGNLYIELGENNLALSYFKQSKALAEELGSQLGIVNSKYSIGILEYNLAHYQNSIVQFNQVLEMSEAYGYNENIKDVYKSLSNAYEASGQFKLALINRKNYETWKDSLINESHLNQVKELEISYESEKKNQQISLLTKEKEIQEKEAQRQATIKRAFIGGIMLIVLLAGSIIYNGRQRIKNQKILSLKNTEIEASHFQQQLSELELKALRAQINPHFLFNCINSINRMILSEETENASRYLTKFSKLMRLILENSEKTTVSLANEIEMLESYIQLETLRFKGKINYDISIDQNIQTENIHIPSMVLQPYVENAIWHGIMHKEDGGKGMITIAITEKENKLHCSIEDNGVGRKQAEGLKAKSVFKSKSLGMKITEERLRLLSKETLDKLVSITDLKDPEDFALGTRVDINIPIS